ncbi:MAG: glycolate oxidase subunit GlcE [Rhodoferax sp.]|nr:glycolate oxidase subunit GlcE [Rhodoferax sp.]
MPTLQHALHTLTDRIHAARADGTSLQIRGGGSKDFLGTSQGAVLDTRALNGVISYEPTELVVTVSAGTPLDELEALLAEKNQYLPFEPPHFRWNPGGRATVGGMVACGLAGPARASVGGVRDYVLGLHLINGLGQHLRFGGQVMKNVAGYDVSRLMVGAYGTLGLLTEISLKVLPIPPAEATLRFVLEQGEALAYLHRWGAQPLPLNASNWLLDDAAPGHAAQPVLYLRLRGAAAAVEAACRRLLAEVPGERLDNAQTAPDWTLCRNQQLPFFTRPRQPDAVLWRLSVPQTTPVLALPGQPLVDWHGGLRWLWAPLSAQAELQTLARQVGGHASMFAGGQSDATSIASRLRSADAVLQGIAERLKTSFDPAHIFNPGFNVKHLHALAHHSAHVHKS